MPRETRPKSATPRGARRTALVAAAGELFSRRPYDDIFIQDIAAAAGVAHGLLFYYFTDKRGLYLAALEQAIDDIAALHRDFVDGETPEQRLRSLIRRHLEYRRDHPHTMLAMMRTGGDPEVDQLYERSRQVGVQFVLELLDIDEPVPPLLRTAIRGGIGFVDELSADWLTNGCDIDIDAVEHLAFSVVVGALATVCTADRRLASIMDGSLPEG